MCFLSTYFLNGRTGRISFQVPEGIIHRKKCGMDLM
jgi:hypothetical protein